MHLEFWIPCITLGFYWKIRCLLKNNNTWVHMSCCCEKEEITGFFPLSWLSSQSMGNAPTGIATAFQTPRSKQLSLSWVAVGESTSAEWTEGERGSARGDTGCWWPDNLGILPTGGEGIALKKRAGLLEAINHLPYFLTALIKSSFPFLYLHQLESFSPSIVLFCWRRSRAKWIGSGHRK